MFELMTGPTPSPAPGLQGQGDGRQPPVVPASYRSRTQSGPHNCRHSFTAAALRSSR